ncbi:MAG: hypothetical protein NT126_10515 [Bacteroidetes bacterium]|nr:hypothetical protein [Bacteroidota bacterium]
MKKILLSTVFVMLSALTGYSQDTIGKANRLGEKNKALNEIDKASLGIGTGQDYGGLGVSLLIYPDKNIGIFGGAGYAFAGLGFNVGTKLRIVSENSTAKVSPYALIMYGYNAAIAVTNAAIYDKLFYGVTFGLGMDYKSRPAKKGYWSLALLIPVRGPEVRAYMNDLKNNHGVEFKNDLLPVTFSIGYRFIIS